MTNEEYIQAFRQWGIDRKIIGNGTFEGQWLKLKSELGELADSMAKKEPVIDDIGDSIVVLVMIEGVSGRDSAIADAINASVNSTAPLSAISHYVNADEYASAIYNYYGSRMIANCAFQLGMVARAHGLTANECMAHAYEIISKRKGYLNENGVFIKEDTNNVQA